MPEVASALAPRELAVASLAGADAAADDHDDNGAARAARSVPAVAVPPHGARDDGAGGAPRYGLPRGAPCKTLPTQRSPCG